MSRTQTASLIAAIACICAVGSFAAEREFGFNAKYLNLPVANEA